MVIIQEKLDLIRFNVDKEPHIRVNTEVCKKCHARPCIYVCPAGLYTLSDGELLYSYEGCLECGACYIACPAYAIDWNYPKGGYGVCFRTA